MDRQAALLVAPASGAIAALDAECRRSPLSPGHWHRPRDPISPASSTVLRQARRIVRPRSTARRAPRGRGSPDGFARPGRFPAGVADPPAQVGGASPMRDWIHAVRARKTPSAGSSRQRGRSLHRSVRATSDTPKPGVTKWGPADAGTRTSVARRSCSGPCRSGETSRSSTLREMPATSTFIAAHPDGCLASRCSSRWPVHSDARARRLVNRPPPSAWR